MNMLAVAAALLLTAAEPMSCKYQGDCGAGEWCHEDACAPACGPGDTCPETMHCIRSGGGYPVCVARTPPADLAPATSLAELEARADNAPCSSHADCAGRRWCHRGTCARLCGEGCPEGTSCVPASGSLVCLPPHPEPASLKPADRVTARMDDMAGITWFNSINADEVIEQRQWTSVEVYYGRFKPSGLGPLRLRAVYHGEDWVFAIALIVKVDDGEPFTVPVPSESQDRSVSNGVWETLDVALGASDVKRICGVRSAMRMRFSGRHDQHDLIVPDNQIVGIQNVCAAWTEAKAKARAKTPAKAPMKKPAPAAAASTSI